MAANTRPRPQRGPRRKYLAIKQRGSATATTFSHWDAQTVEVTLSVVQPPPRERAQYLAASYCWGSTGGVQSESKPDNMSSILDYMPVFIEQLDGTTREVWAPRRVLRRAMRHAEANQLKYIWIDQE